MRCLLFIIFVFGSCFELVLTEQRSALFVSERLKREVVSSSREPITLSIPADLSDDVTVERAFEKVRQKRQAVPRPANNSMVTVVSE
jgi:hypothetical protein